MVSVGEVFEGKVVSVMPFGAFVDLGKRKSGLIHISELSDEYVKDINECVKKGDVLKVKVLKIDENGKISLTAKKSALTAGEKRDVSDAKKASVRPAEVDFFNSDDNLSFEDKLSKFKTDSDENMRILKRNAASKRSGGYSRKGNYSF